MSYVIEFADAEAQPSAMSWEEDTLVERLIRMLRERFSPVARLDGRRARSTRLRYCQKSAHSGRVKGRSGCRRWAQ